MKNNLIIENFKCFRDATNVCLSDLNVCTGMNSVGKSTLVQTLLLLRQTIENINDDNNVVLLNNEYLNLGSTNQIMSTSQEMKLKIDSLFFSFKAGDDKLSLLLDDTNYSKELFAIEESIPLLNKTFYYLNAERLGPRNYQKIVSHKHLNCGYNGEYTFDIVAKNMGEPVENTRRFSSNDKRVPDFEKQVEYWLAYIANGVEVNFSADTITQLSHMRVRQSVLDTQFSSPYNYGFGISYVLPIIVTGLMACQNSILIVENPEAHLHPAGQSRIGEFLAQVSSDKVQIVIETHSEHVINGIRKYALKNQISSENISINYFSINSIDNKHNVERLNMNEKMDILNWPEGFFDQETIDLKELRKLRSNMR